MFQGVSSSAGKSICATALCRILKKDGFRVAPFKAQNMSLNSYVTTDGGEMGRAQALQALACGLEPNADMNPVLLKPMGDSISQVIVRGRVYDNLLYAEYIKLKSRLWRDLCEAYYNLADSVDIMILEGAGSPAEINLQKHDIVNMRMAQEAGAAVLLVADIDRGGAFAALAGTMSLIRPSERKLVQGFILNRFRGDKSLLEPALMQMENRYKRSFAGIIPMIEDLCLPEEDSASLEGSHGVYRDFANSKGAGCLDVLVPHLPALANFTDLDPLALEKLVRIRLVKDASEFGKPDLVIIPGSRKVGAALAWLREKGLATRIREYAEMALKYKKGNILGICAGLQLMGERIEDPCSVEGGGSCSALGLLPLVTRLEREKILRRRKALTSPLLCGSEEEVEAYEIHHGRSDLNRDVPIVVKDCAGYPLGWGRQGNAEDYCRVWGTYLHGIFDNNKFRHAFLGRLAAEAGLEGGEWQQYDIEKEIDRLADIFRQNMDMEMIYKILGL